MSSTYCTQSDIEYAFGTNAVSDWSNIDGDGTKAAARITEAIAMAGEQVDAVLRTTQYAHRLPIQDASGSTPRLIKNLAAVLAGVWLYDAQGVRDIGRSGRPYHNQAFRRRWAIKTLENIRTGEIKIDAES